MKADTFLTWRSLIILQEIGLDISVVKFWRKAHFF